MAFQGGYVEAYAPTDMSLDEAKKVVEASFPYVTVQTFADQGKLSLTGVQDDVKKAVEVLEQLDSPKTEATPSTETYTPTNINLQVLKTAVDNALPSVKSTIQGATLVMTGAAKDLAKAKSFVKELDIPAARDRVTKVYTLEYTSAEAAADMLLKTMPDIIAVPGPAYFAPKPAQFQPLSAESKSVFTVGGSSGYGATAGMQEEEIKTSRTKTLILAGTQDAIDRALALLEATDIAPEQVMIEAKVMDISPEYSKDLGVLWSWGDFTFLEQNPENPRSVEARDPEKFLHAAPIGDFGRLPWDFSARLDAMIQNKKAKILATPRIAVVDSSDANIFIGDLIRYTVLREVNPITGNIFDVETVPVGIALLVRPRVNTDGYITIKIHPVVSIVTGYIAGIPQTSSREADSTLRVKSGETIVIGGLLRDEEIKTMTRVPGLSSIPILGELFKHESTNRRQSEVVIFITPRIMQQGAAQ